MSLLGDIFSGVGALGSLSSNIQNLNFQKENLEYQKALQQQIFEREDSAYQRTVNDMRQAGLSPLVMNGTNSSGSVINTTAPQNQFNEMLSSVVGVASSLGSLAQIQSGIARTDAETQYIQEQAKNLSIKNDYEADKLGMENQQLRLGVASQLKDEATSNYYGYSNSMPDAIKQLLILSSGKSFHNEYVSKDGSTHMYPDNNTDSLQAYVQDNQTLNTSEVLRFVSPILDILKAFR